MIEVEVFRIRFSQEQLHPFFHRRGPVADVLPEIGNEPLSEGLAPSVRLVPPFERIRCTRCDVHGDLITLDNRRLYALQLAAVERWPARCLASVCLVEVPAWERHKLSEGSGHGKPLAFMEHLCGDVQVQIASRGSVDLWCASTAVLERCGTVSASHPDVFEVWEEVQESLRAERQARDVADADDIAKHAAVNDHLWDSLDKLRLRAAEAPGVVVRRVGVPGDRDGYISVSAQARALNRGL